MLQSPPKYSFSIEIEISATVIPDFVIGSCFDFQKLSTTTKLLANTAIAHTAMSPTKQRMSLNKKKSVRKITEKDVLLSSNNRPVMKKYNSATLL